MYNELFLSVKCIKDLYDGIRSNTGKPIVYMCILLTNRPFSTSIKEIMHDQDKLFVEIYRILWKLLVSRKNIQ